MREPFVGKGIIIRGGSFWVLARGCHYPECYRMPKAFKDLNEKVGTTPLHRFIIFDISFTANILPKLTDSGLKVLHNIRSLEIVGECQHATDIKLELQHYYKQV